MVRSLILYTLLSILCLAPVSCCREPVLVIQVSDPQMGFQSNNADMTYEIEKLSQTVSAINTLEADAVVFTGDLVHNPSDEKQWEKFISLSKQISPKIKTFYLPGNHDITSCEGKLDMSSFTSRLGNDRFNETIKGISLIGINSNFIKSDKEAEEEQKQFLWLEKALGSSKQTTLVFAHHPFFLNSKDETDEYFNITTIKREKYFNLFEQYGADAVFCGHKHDNSISCWNNIPMVTTSALGRQLGSADSGIRAIVCKNGKVFHRYFGVEEIPASKKELIIMCLK